MADRPDYHGFIAHLRKWGLSVEETPGWRDRGRPYNFYPRAVFCHHTASSSSSGNFGSSNIVTFGRSDLPGPLSQFLLGRNGVVRVIAGGYSNHAGYGGPHAGIGENQGNSFSYGIEAENNGVGERWPAEQLNAYYRLCAALLDWMGYGPDDVWRVFGHKEWTSRKIDPAGINMDTFRSNVRKALLQGPSAVVIHLSNVTPGNEHRDVRRIKRRLAKRGFYDEALLQEEFRDVFGPGLLGAYAKWQRHLGFEGPEADGHPGRYSLEQLGFLVKK